MDHPGPMVVLGADTAKGKNAEARPSAPPQHLSSALMMCTYITETVVMADADVVVLGAANAVLMVVFLLFLWCLYSRRCTYKGHLRSLRSPISLNGAILGG